jgi:hypothetical protein
LVGITTGTRSADVKGLSVSEWSLALAFVPAILAPMDMTEVIVRQLLEGVAKMEVTLRDHAARLNVLQVSTAVLLGGEKALEAMKVLDDQRKILLQGDSSAAELQTTLAMIDALRKYTRKPGFDS